MKTKNNVGKIWAAVFVVALFLISSIPPVNAVLLDVRVKSIEKNGSTADSETGIAEQKLMPTLDDDNNDILVANDNLKCHKVRGLSKKYFLLSD